MLQFLAPQSLSCVLRTYWQTNIFPCQYNHGRYLLGLLQMSPLRRLLHQVRLLCGRLGDPRPGRQHPRPSWAKQAHHPLCLYNQQEVQVLLLVSPLVPWALCAVLCYVAIMMLLFTRSSKWSLPKQNSCPLNSILNLRTDFVRNGICSLSRMEWVLGRYSGNCVRVLSGKLCWPLARWGHGAR